MRADFFTFLGVESGDFSTIFFFAQEIINAAFLKMKLFYIFLNCDSNLNLTILKILSKINIIFGYIFEKNHLCLTLIVGAEQAPKVVSS